MYVTVEMAEAVLRSRGEEVSVEGIKVIEEEFSGKEDLGLDDEVSARLWLALETFKTRHGNSIRFNHVDSDGVYECGCTSDGYECIGAKVDLGILSEEDAIVNLFYVIAADLVV